MDVDKKRKRRKSGNVIYINKKRHTITVFFSHYPNIMNCLLWKCWSLKCWCTSFNSWVCWLFFLVLKPVLVLFVSHISHPNILMSSHAQGSHHSSQHLHVQPCQRLTPFTPTSSCAAMPKAHTIHPNIFMSSHAKRSHHSPQYLHVQPCQTLTPFTPTSSCPAMPKAHTIHPSTLTSTAHAIHPQILMSHHTQGSCHSPQHPHIPSHLRLTSFTATSSCPIRSTAHIIHSNIHMSHYIHSSHHLLQHSHIQPCPRLTLHSNNLINLATPKAHTSFSNIQIAPC